MKKLLTILLIAASLTLNAQSKDSVDINKVPLFSIQDLQELDNQVLQELPAKHTDIIRAWIRQRIAVRVQQLQAPPKKK